MEHLPGHFFTAITSKLCQKRIDDKPVLIFWGDRDDFIKNNNLEKWKNFFSSETTYAFEAGHFVQEEKTEKTIAVMRNWLSD